MQQQLGGDSAGGSDSGRTVRSVQTQIHHWISDTYFSGQSNTDSHSDTLVLYGATLMLRRLVAVALYSGLQLCPFVVARVLLYTSAALLVVGLLCRLVHAACLSLGYLAHIERQLLG